MKIRRKEAYDFHKAAIDALYALGEPSKLWSCMKAICWITQMAFYNKLR